MKKNSPILIYTIFLFMFVLMQAANGQIVNGDYAGFIQKFDTTFNGVGPEVYYLPPPRSKSETLIDEYSEISSFNDSINQVFHFHKLINNFQNTSNYNRTKSIIEENSVNLENIGKIIEAQIQSQNHLVAMGLLNESAKQHIISKNYTQAELFLNQALQIATNELDNENRNILLTNLYHLYLFNHEPLKANQIEEISYKEAKRNKSLIDQGNSLIKIAVVQGSQNQYTKAASTIIKQAIPLFNRAKNSEGKIRAWVSLAEMYANNKQYPEAQWFLIQAKELSKSNNIANFNLDIEFLLGYSKFHQNNLLVSQKELTGALLLAKEHGDKYRELSVTQMLGEISMKQNKVEEAEGFLKSYWNLRNQLF